MHMLFLPSEALWGWDKGQLGETKHSSRKFNIIPQCLLEQSRATPTARSQTPRHRGPTGSPGTHTADLFCPADTF